MRTWRRWFTQPALSVVGALYNMWREAKRTLYSLTSTGKRLSRTLLLGRMSGGFQAILALRKENRDDFCGAGFLVMTQIFSVSAG